MEENFTVIATRTNLDTGSWWRLVIIVSLCAGAADIQGARESPQVATESTPVQGQIGAVGQVPVPNIHISLLCCYCFMRLGTMETKIIEAGSVCCKKQLTVSEFFSQE